MSERLAPEALKERPLGELLGLAQRLRDERGAGTRHVPTVRRKVALLSTSTTQFLARLLDLFADAMGLSLELYEAPFGSLVESVMNPQAELYALAPDVVVLLPHLKDLSFAPRLFATSSEVNERVEQEVAFWSSLWQRLAQQLPRVQVVHASFDLPAERTLGNLEATLASSRLSFVRRVNLALTERRERHVQMFDLDYLTSQFGLSRAIDPRGYYLSKQYFSFEFLPTLAFALARELALAAGLFKKCAVLDLDGTLWGGTIGEDGLEGIVLGPDSAEGEAFLDFQRYLRALKERGVALAVCSKNDDAVAREVFTRHPHMQLGLDDIACFIANWDDKAKNVAAIAETLSLGRDALVFIDNSPEERHRVRSALPEISVLELPEDPAEYVRALDAAGYFELAELTREGASRAASYVEERRRTETQASFADYDAYLQSLSLVAAVEAIGGANLPRVAELIKRTNQWNLRTARHSEADVARLVAARENAGFAVSLRDRFGAYGIISVVLLLGQGDHVFIDTWLMSCRVLKKGVEALVLAELIAQAERRGMTRIVGEYIPSPKNAMVREHYERHGFRLVEEQDGRKRYELSLAGERPRLVHYIRREERAAP